MSMNFVDTNKKRIAFRKLLKPITWFHKDAVMEDTYKFRANPDAKDCIIGYREDYSQYEIFCPAEIRDALVVYLNHASKV